MGVSNTIIADEVYTARKQHRCDHCLQPIVPGDVYRRVRGVWEGDPGVFRSHFDCAEVATKLHREHGVASDEGITLSSDIETEDYLWILAEWPVVAARLGIKARE